MFALRSGKWTGIETFKQLSNGCVGCAEKALSLSSSSPLEGIMVTAYSPDGTMIVAGGGGGEVVIWDSHLDTQQRMLDCKTGAVRRLSWCTNSTKARPP